MNVRIATHPFDRNTGGVMYGSPGISSSYIFSLKPGDKVMVSGPFGEFHPLLYSKREMLYIGGGAGMAPLRSHILHLLKTETNNQIKCGTICIKIFIRETFQISLTVGS